MRNYSLVIGWYNRFSWSEREIVRKTLITLPLVLLGKFGMLAKMVKAVKFLKFGKVFLTLGSMSLSVFAYSFRTSFWFALGFVILLFFHEMGHVLAFRKKGIKVSAPIFIPMLGAAVFAPPFTKKEDEAYTGYAGPLFGALSAIGLFGVWWLLPGQPKLLLVLSYAATFLNLFNLIPLRPLDGGRVAQIIGDWVKYIGFGALVLVTLLFQEPGFLLIWIFILSETSLNTWLKFYLGATCEIVMIAMMLFGVGHQSLLENAFDVIMSSIFNLGFYFTAHRRLGITDKFWHSEGVEVDTRVRLLYCGLYFGLILVLVGMLILQSQLIHGPISFE